MPRVSNKPQKWVIEDFAKQYGVPEERLPIPLSPPVIATFQAIMSRNWEISPEVKPYRTYIKPDGHITITFEAPPKAEDALRAIWEAVTGLSPETGIILCILLERIARLWDPRGIVIISWKDIAELRGVGLRHGLAKELREATQAEILRLAMLRLSMVWKDYRNGGTITFGTKEHPDRLIDLVEVQYEKDGKTVNAFSIRAGQALGYFLDAKEGRRMIGYFSRALLQIDPYREALVWKLGVYWTFLGEIAQKNGGYATAKPETILTAIGEVPDFKRPGYTIERFVKAHKRLMELGVLSKLPEGKEPQGRGKDRLRRWLQTPITAKLHPDLYKRKSELKLLASPIAAETTPIIATNTPIAA